MPPEPLVFYTQSCILNFFIPCFFLEFLKCVFMVGIADVRLFSGCVVMARTGTGKSGWPLGFFWVFRNSVAVRGPPPPPAPRPVVDMWQADSYDPAFLANYGGNATAAWADVVAGRGAGPTAANTVPGLCESGFAPSSSPE